MSGAPDPMAEIRASFFIECEELLEALQDGLQTIDDGDDDPETINVVFRAVHSIKGGAGAFGLEDLVHFAHRFETVMDEVRSGRMSIDADALRIFFLAGDHLNDLVCASRDDAPMPDAQTATLIESLDGLMGGAPAIAEAEEEIDFQPAGIMLSLDLDDDGDETGTLPELPPLGGDLSEELPPLPGASASAAIGYDIRFRPFTELYETGNEPAMILACLGELGPIKVTCDTSGLPAFSDMSPELPYLSWNIALEADIAQAEITSVFEFVEGLCELEIRPRASQGNMTAPEAQVPSPPISDADALPSSPLDLAVPEAEALTPTEADAEATLPAAVAESKPAPQSNTAAKAKQPAAKSVVRVDLERIERLVNLVGELVINQAMLSQSLEKSALSPHSDAMNGLEEFQRLTRDIQDSVMMIRAQPVKTLFQRMARIVREASAAVDKNVRLVTEGETTEVDKTVIERLADPLTHMIRNAVDHGLENSETRTANGKNPQGKVILSAAHRSGRVVIEVSDDGAGINRERVLQIAKDKNLVPADANPSDGEIDNLLFLPGFSTASQVSNLSGRGVGMDVVRTEIQSLGGRVSIQSDPGEGTRFTISLPLTLAVLDGMVIGIADQTLVLPLNLVIETMTLGQDDVQMMRPGSPVIQVRGDFVPVIDLGHELGYRNALEDFDGAVALLISHENGNRAALIIDNILDQRQVVIKGLNDSLYRAPGVAAATILGDGQIALILDPSDIMTQALSPTPLPPGITAPQREGLPA